MDIDISAVLQGASMLIGGAATLAAILPQTRKAGPVLTLLRKLLDLVAMNIGNAKNATRRD